jgi:hypothetical protein
MPFIDLKEKFLKSSDDFKNDRGFNGSLDKNEEPLINTPIPFGEDGIDSTKVISDIIVRGDATPLLTLKKRGDDISRIGKWFITPQGISFASKQNVLSRLGVETQGEGEKRLVLNEGPYLPTSTLGSVTTSGLGIYLNKQGVDPRIDDTNVFRFGVPTYAKNTNNLNLIRGGDTGKTNRLVELKNEKIVNISGNEILDYSGGPDSILGIGKTRIKFADQRTGLNNPKFNTFTDVDTREGTSKKDIIINNELLSRLYNFELPTSNNIFEDFRSEKIKKFYTTSKISSTISKSPDYKLKNIELRVNLGNPGDNTRNRFDYSKGIKYDNKKVDALDTINAFPLYKASSVNTNDTNIDGVVNDLVKFRIAAIDNDNPIEKVFMHFRAFLESFEDTYSPTWNSEKYVGRGDSLYRYQGFTRTMSLRWNIVAQSAQELMPMYRKLNYLASNTMPDYSDKGFMRGSLIQLTVGEYLYEQPGFITQLSFTPNFDAGWEIGVTSGGTQASIEGGEIIEVGELPLMISVQMSFTPIHEFVPSKVKGEFVNKDNYKPSRNSKFKDQRLDIPDSGDSKYLINQIKNYIALTREKENFDNY